MLNVNDFNSEIEKSIGQKITRITPAEYNKLLTWRSLDIECVHEDLEHALNMPAIGLLVGDYHFALTANTKGFTINLTSIRTSIRNIPVAELSGKLMAISDINPETITKLSKEELSGWIKAHRDGTAVENHEVLYKLLNHHVFDELDIEYATVTAPLSDNSAKASFNFTKLDYNLNTASIVFNILFTSSSMNIIEKIDVSLWSPTLVAADSSKLTSVNINPFMLPRYNIEQIFDHTALMTFFAYDTDACLAHPVLGNNFKEILERQLENGEGVRVTSETSGLRVTSDGITLTSHVHENRIMVLHLHKNKLVAGTTNLL